ncbi:MAG: fructosamine kinase family protein [Bacteroidota bacterium]
MVTKDLENHLQQILGETIVKVTPITGGDISATFLLKAAGNRYFLKCSSEAHATAMYRCEADGLQRIGDTGTIAVPKFLFAGTHGHIAYLILEFIESKSPNSSEFSKLGHQLALLHQSGETLHFGGAQSNFIGNLKQNNTPNANWSYFYVHERLIPQLQLALKNGYLGAKYLPKTGKLLQTCEVFFENVTPSLLHGDFWSGNFMISVDGTPYIIDPAVYVGHSEVDLSMSKLFGGYDKAFYSAYYEVIPPHGQQKALTEIYQLYYLLVHLNLFGTSYTNSVLSILKHYFF